MDRQKAIYDYLGEGEMFCQLAEEAAELAQAALQYHMSLVGYRHLNLVPEEAYRNLVEEIGDVTLCLRMLGLDLEPESSKTGELAGLPLLCRLSEKAAELSKAALKCRRAYGYSRNVTPVTSEEAYYAIEEKVADVMLCIRGAGLDRGAAAEKTSQLIEAKVERWYNRLHGRADGKKEGQV